MADASRSGRSMAPVGRLQAGERCCVASAAVLVLSTFLPWFRVELFGIVAGVNGWDVDRLAATACAFGGMLVGGVVLGTRVGTATVPAFLARTSTWAAVGLGCAFVVAVRAARGVEHAARAYGLGVAIVAALGVAAGAAGAAWSGPAEGGVGRRRR